MGAKLVLLPPQRDLTREWAAALARSAPDLVVVAPETLAEATREVADADAAFGTLPPELLRLAGKLRWLQAPAAAPPAGYYYPELVAHPVVVTNFRGIYNDHIAAHIMAFVLAFARGLHRYIPRQLQGRWDTTDADNVLHLPACTALIV